MRESNTTEIPKDFSSFDEFYRFYLKEHSNPTCRALHYLGSTWVLLLIVISLASAKLIPLVLIPLVGYGHAWIGHFMFEKNKPATFKWPVFSFLADWVMYKDFLLGKFRKDQSAFVDS